jgi:hypothetical protein
MATCSASHWFSKYLGFENLSAHGPFSAFCAGSKHASTALKSGGMVMARWSSTRAASGGGSVSRVKRNLAATLESSPRLTVIES